MSPVVGLQCLRCGSRYPAASYTQDCPACRPVAPSNLVVCYDDAFLTPRPRPRGHDRKGLWRYGELLPVPERDGISLGEGGSPLHRLARAGGTLGLGRLFAKDETRNPTWSFKDRLACLAVSAARRMGAGTIVSSSSGNAGAAAAAYAARAGLPCVVFTARGAAGPMLTQIAAYGATVVEVATKADRWTMMAHAVSHYGWFPTSPFFGPAVGSNPYGIEGYKTLAYEIAEALDWQIPDVCVVPVCYGDALVGLWRGFAEMRAFGWTSAMPRLVAAETSGSISQALAGSADTLNDIPRTEETVASSISATRGTYQALAIVRRTGGTAANVGNAAMMRWQQALGREEGLYVEPSSAAALAAIEQLRGTGRIAERETVVALLTASGLKDPGRTDAILPAPVRVPADMEGAIATLQGAGVFPRS